MHNVAKSISEKIEEARTEIDLVYAPSPKFRWALVYLVVPLEVLGLEVLLPERRGELQIRSTNQLGLCSRFARSYRF